MKKNILLLAIVVCSFSNLIFAQKNNKSNNSDLNELLKNLDDDMLNSGLGDMLQQLQQSQNNIKYEKTYTFKLHTKIKSTITNNGKTESFVVDFYSSENASMMKPQSAEMKKEMKGMEDANMIIDSKNKTLITLDEKNKKGMAMSLGGIENAMKKFGDKYATKEEPKEDKPNFTMKKTGKSKMILGYLCYEYLVITKDANEHHEANMWVANEASIGFFNIMEAMGKSMFAKSSSYKNNINGAILEMTSKDMKTGDTYTMTVLEINKKPITKDLSSYKISSGFDFDND